MSYRRHAAPEQAKAWKKWIGDNRAHLERINLPLATYQDAAHWEDFLQNGHLHWHTDGPPFDFGDLSTEQMEQLYELLERCDLLENPPLLSWLRVRLGKDYPQ